MEQSIVKNRFMNSVKAFLYAALLFSALVFVIGLMLRFTGLPERFTGIYMIAALSFVCLFLGLFAGYIMRKKGFLYGALFSMIFLLGTIAMAMTVSGNGIQLEISLLRYGVCVICGTLGGMIGVNVRV